MSGVKASHAGRTSSLSAATCDSLRSCLRITERDQTMKMMLIALATAGAILTGSGLARAENTTLTLTPFGAPTNGQMETAKIEQPRASTPVALTNDQMEKVTAGHYTGYYHDGWFKIWDGYWGAISGDWQWAWGTHWYETHIYYLPK
jgi:hypothetical protein